MKIAVIGAGVSGLVAAHRLAPDHEVTVYEAGDYAGGHTNTIDIEVDGQRLPVDTGFIVYNQSTYPNFCRLLDELGVDTGETSMSFGVSDPASGFEYGTVGLGGWIARRRNLVDPRLYRLIPEIFRFFRRAGAALDLAADSLAGRTLRDFLDEGGFSETFRRFYIVPMTAAVWSAPPSTALEFPALTLLRFLRNHGLLSANGAPTWRYVRGGSRTYVQRLLQRFGGRLHLSSPVARVRRHADGSNWNCWLAVRGATTESSSPPTATRPWRCSPTPATPNARYSARSTTRPTRRCCTPMRACCRSTAVPGPRGTIVSTPTRTARPR